MALILIYRFSKNSKSEHFNKKIKYERFRCKKSFESKIKSIESQTLNSTPVHVPDAKEPMYTVHAHQLHEVSSFSTKTTCLQC